MIPRVAASEKGGAQTARVKARAGLWDRDVQEVRKPKGLERPATEGDSPVGATRDLKIPASRVARGT